MIERKIKHLRMMGYNTSISPDDASLIVWLETEKGFRASCSIGLFELSEDFVIERVVRLINGVIMNCL